MYDWDFGYIIQNSAAYARGALVTIKLSVLIIATGTLLGFPVALLLRLPRLLVYPVIVLVEIMRAIPDLVWIFFVYFFPYKALLGITPFSPFICAFIALSFVLALFSGVLYSSALDQVPNNQLLGAKTLGFTKKQIWQHVTLPSIIRHTLPGMIGYWIGMLKATSLASVVGVQDVVYMAKVGMAQNARALEAWIMVAIVYIILVVPAVIGLRRLEKMDWMQRQ